MKILLVGEYSGLHNSLKEGLVELGHEVLLISSGDFFKDYPSDIKLKRQYDHGLGRKLKVFIYKFFKRDITSEGIKRQFFSMSEKLKGFDAVQLINESPLTTTPEIAEEMISFLKKHNQRLFLLCCGSNYMSVAHALSDAHPYSILHGFKHNTEDKAKYQYILGYLKAPYKKLHDYLYSQIDGVIASDMDYHLPLKDHPKYVGLIPNPVNLSKLTIPTITVKSPIVIFMGINQGNRHTKGIHFFEKALKIVQKKFPEKIHVEIVENLPYATYIEKYNNAHILLDQVLAYDQGYNALEAMAKGKAVFTGAETEFYKYYDLRETVAINALPDPEKIADALEDLINNPSKIIKIGTAAQVFVKKEHDHVKVAQQYVTTWTSETNN